jgi:hypothetical protein
VVIRRLVADGLPHGVEPALGLLDPGRVGGVAASGGVAEDEGIFAHQVVDGLGAAGQRDVVADDRIEAEEGFLVVKDVELKQRRAGVEADLGAGALDQAEISQLVYGVQDGTGVRGGDLAGAIAVGRIVGEVVGAAGQGHRPGGVGQQEPDGQGAGLGVADPDLVQGFLDDAVQGLPRESGEIDRDVLAVERALDVGPDADRPASPSPAGPGRRPGCLVLASGVSWPQ